jgi:glycine/D-amino acid oxidase-like deaminating enzyme
MAETQSPTLPKTSDIVVIGSGITGTSVAKFLLDGSDVNHVTLLEARTLCSGATGRNGGHLVTFGAAGYSKMKTNLGQDMANRILKFTQDTCDQVLDAGRKYAAKESQIRVVTRVRAFGDQKSLDEAKSSIEEYENDYPEEKGRFDFIDDNALKEVLSGSLSLIRLTDVEIRYPRCCWSHSFSRSCPLALQIYYKSPRVLEAQIPLPLLH